MAYQGPGRFLHTPSVAETQAAYGPNPGHGYRYSGMTPAQAVDLGQVANNIQAGGTGNTGRLLEVNTTLNPRFDPRIYAQSNAGMTGMTVGRPGPLVRGRMSQWEMESTPVKGARGTYVRALNFLYNPNTIQHQYSFNEDYPAAINRDPNDLGPNLMTGQTITWTLLFNRTYEMAENVEHPGVLGDITALEYMLGGSEDGGGILATSVLAVFGATPQLKAFAYTGWVTGVSIRYVMFTHRMMPSVAEVDLALSRRMIPRTMASSMPEIGTADGGAAAGGAAAQRQASGQGPRRSSAPTGRQSGTTPGMIPV